MHAVISNTDMYANPAMSLHIHVESPKLGIQFALKYEICELKRLQKLESNVGITLQNTCIYSQFKKGCPLQTLNSKP